MSWLLVIVIFGTGMMNIPYTDYDKCLQAARQIEQSAGSYNTRALCVVKD